MVATQQMQPTASRRDAYGSVEDGGPEDERLDWLLDNWARWMRRPFAPRGFPTKSVGLRSVASQDFEAMVSDVDVRLARAMDAILESVDKEHRGVVHHVCLASVWVCRDDLAATHAEARVQIRALMRKRRVE